jgi:hypothetical protein
MILEMDINLVPIRRVYVLHWIQNSKLSHKSMTRNRSFPGVVKLYATSEHSWIVDHCILTCSTDFPMPIPISIRKMHFDYILQETETSSPQLVPPSIPALVLGTTRIHIVRWLLEPIHIWTDAFEEEWWHHRGKEQRLGLDSLIHRRWVRALQWNYRWTNSLTMTMTTWVIPTLFLHRLLALGVKSIFRVRIVAVVVACLRACILERIESHEYTTEIGVIFWEGK